MGLQKNTIQFTMAKRSMSMDINLLFYFKMSAARSETGVHQMQFTISLADSIMYLFKKKNFCNAIFGASAQRKKEL